MQIQLPELIDRITISEIKIEKLRLPHLKEELEAYQEALNEFADKNIEIKQEWFDRLKKVNTKIFELEFAVREIMDADDVWKSAEEKFGFAELGRRVQIISKFVVERANIKNEIAEQTGYGFKEVKTDYCGQKIQV